MKLTIGNKDYSRAFGIIVMLLGLILVAPTSLLYTLDFKIAFEDSTVYSLNWPLVILGAIALIFNKNKYFPNMVAFYLSIVIVFWIF